MQYVDAEKGLLISEFDTSLFSLTVIPIVGMNVKFSYLFSSLQFLYLF